MKEETKELIDWIKKQISLAGTIVTDISQSYWQQDRDEALEFLNSLPEIESHLCRGGYIQDKNGTPCCEGDKVKVKDVEYILYWSKGDGRFYMEPVTMPSLLEKLSLNIEKVEE